MPLANNIYVLLTHVHKKCVLLAVAAILLLCLPYQVDSEISLEHKVKAAYIFKILKFIEWEKNPAVSITDATINICIVGTGSIVEAINLLDSKQANNRRINIIKGTLPRSGADCHVIFITRGEKDYLDSILLKFNSNNILTISDIAGFAQSGGMIELATINDKVKLIANLFSIEKSTIRVSSKLLDVAELVKNNGNGPGMKEP